MEKEIEIIYIEESFWQSLLADITTFSMILGAMYINHVYLGGSAFWAVVLFCMVLLTIVAKAKAKIVKFNSRQEAVNELLKKIKDNS